MDMDAILLIIFQNAISSNKSFSSDIGLVPINK